MKFTLPSLIFALLKMSREMVYRAQGEPIPYYGLPEEQALDEKKEESKENEEPEMVVPKTDHQKIFRSINELILALQQN